MLVVMVLRPVEDGGGTVGSGVGSVPAIVCQ